MLDILIKECYYIFVEYIYAYKNIKRSLVIFLINFIYVSTSFLLNFKHSQKHSKKTFKKNIDIHNIICYNTCKLNTYRYINENYKSTKSP